MLEFLYPENMGLGVAIFRCYLVWKLKYNYFRFSGRHFEFPTSGYIAQFYNCGIDFLESENMRKGNLWNVVPMCHRSWNTSGQSSSAQTLSHQSVPSATSASILIPMSRCGLTSGRLCRAVSPYYAESEVSVDRSLGRCCSRSSCHLY